MPEGHTVHRLARTLTELFADEVLAVTSPQGRFAAGAALLDGRRAGRAEAWGKQLFMAFDDGHPSWLRVHLGLYGAWAFASDGTRDVVHAIGAPRKRVSETETVPAAGADAPHAPAVPGPGAASGAAGPWEPPEPRGQVRVRLRGEHAVADLTGPTACEVVTGAEKDAVVARLGPDPVRADADPQGFVEAVARSRAPVASLLMDQSVVAGVGNIYRAEALFRARLAPVAPGRSVPRETLRALWDDLVVLMADGVRTGRIVTTRPEDRGDGEPALDAAGRVRSPRRGAARQNTDGDTGVVPRAESFYVYQRDGSPCRVCGTPVALRELAGRKLYWCPSCQR